MTLVGRRFTIGLTTIARAAVREAERDRPLV